MVAPERIEFGRSRLRLQTLIRLRWVAIAGQTVAVLLVHYGLGLTLPFAACMAVIVASALSNVGLQIYFPPSKRIRSYHAMLMLGFDILQLTALLYLTGGLQNPFSLLIVVPVAVSASTQPLRITVVLCTLALACASALILFHLPLPGTPTHFNQLPLLYRFGLWSALVCCIVFLATYAWRTAQETRLMSDALAATELLLAREQKLSALDGLAAAAAHELGTPLSTITLVSKELLREIPEDSPWREDILLLRGQALRCGEILSRLTKNTGATDLVFSTMSLGHLIEEVVAPFRTFEKNIEVRMLKSPAKNGKAEAEPVISRNPGLIYALSNLVENAVDYAHSKVEIMADWSRDDITLSITDDGPGFAPHIFGRLGEPYVTTRPRFSELEEITDSGGMGLGFFIAKTLIERSSGSLMLDNRDFPESGAVVRVILKRPEGVAAAPAGNELKPF
jgi:two-component system sensor histidine kinase RegB